MNRTIVRKALEAGLTVPGYAPLPPKPEPKVKVKAVRVEPTYAFNLDQEERMAQAADPEHIPRLLAKYFGFEDMQPFHLELILKMFEGGKHIVNWPTDHGKSRVSSFWFPLLSLMNDPDASHIIVGANIADSKRWLQAMQFELENNEELLRDYPWVGKPKAKENRLWSATQFNVVGRTRNTPNPSVFVASAGSSSVYQRRGKLILDDTEGPDHRNSPWKRTLLYDFIKLAGIRCYEDKFESDRPLLVALGTPWDPNSVYFKLESEGWQVSRVSVYTDEQTEGKSTNPKDRKLRWPAKLEKVHEQWAHMNREQFAIAYLMDPAGGDENRLSYQQIADLASSGVFELPDQHLTLVSLDPASGSTNRRADYAGIAVVKIVWKADESLPLVDVLEAHKFTGGLYEQVHKCAALSYQHGCSIIYETNSQQGGNYREVFQTVYPEIAGSGRLLGHYTTAAMKVDEQLGITVLRTLLRDRRLRVPASSLGEDGMKALFTEISDMGSGPRGHDHIAAAIWFVIRHAHTHGRGAPQFRRTMGPKTFGSGGALNWRSWRTG